MAHVAHFFFVLTARLILWIRPALPAICAVFAWTVTAILALNIVETVRTGAANVRQMHRIPCANCMYATDSYQLKCSVHPTEAFSESAIGCGDFADESAASGTTFRTFSDSVG